MKISISSIKLFKACRKAWQFRYIEDLEPVKKAEALEVGLSYHEKLEQLYNQGVCECGCDKESAMALAYEKYIYPHFKVKKAEEWFEYTLPSGHVLVGRVDGLTENGELVEHKTTGMAITEEYEYNLQWDEQILAYMLATGARKMWYTVVRKPTIRQKQNETDEEFFKRMVAWYDEETESKIRLIEIERTDEEVERFCEELDTLVVMAERAKHEPDLIYKNPMYCNCWGRRCEYSSICLHYDPAQEYIDFVKGGRSDYGNQEN